MSQHPSLRSKSKDTMHKSVLKRYERLKLLKEKEKWDEEQSVYGLPKVKIMKFKMKKEKAAEAAVAPEGAEGEAPVPAQEGAAKVAAKPETKKADTKKKESKK